MKMTAKLLTGYGVIIVLMLIFIAIVISTNVNTVNNVNQLHGNSDLQTLTKDLLTNFYEARMNARTIYIKNDDQVYNNIVGNLQQVQVQADKINALLSSDSGLSQYTQQMTQVLAQIEQWSGQIAQVQEANKTVDNIVAMARENQLSLMSQSMGILNYQLELSQDEADQQIAVASRMRRIERLDFGARLAQNVEAIGNSFELILRTYDLSRLQESLDLLESTVDELQAFVDDSTLQFNLETGGALLQALADYKQDVENFVANNSQRDNIVSEAQASGEQALVLIEAVLADIDAATETLVSNTARTATGSLVLVIGVAVASLIFSVLFALYLARIISRPIIKMQRVIDQVGLQGDMRFSEETMAELAAEARSKDELGQSMRSFITLIEHLSRTGEQLTTVAKGDLTAEVKLLSENDTIGQALSGMLANLNQMFGEIRSSTEQVTIGSKQIADGAQSLSQASTQQSAAVEQLSATISGVASQTQDNAEMAKNAASLANAIKENAEKGSAQMDQMMAAVNEINQASQSINKVIKVIDDIAFQTNILALNAAVEAARAGQHGKGFAVVAEEVRSLAGKSAEAAKDTGSLIANSITKAELGARIAAETATSLADIVQGINESTRIVNDIALSSEQQSEYITQINTGIDQVSMVVQQNSATAQQSAAASQQLSGQSHMLESLLSQFQLKEAAYKRLAAPVTARLNQGEQTMGKY